MLAALLVPHTPAGAATPFRSSAWLPYWSMSAAANEVANNPSTVRTASMFWYDARSCSSIGGYSGAGDRSVIHRLRSRHIAVVATVTASGLSPSRAVSCFSNAKRRTAHIKRLVQIVRSRAYAGLDLDYENLALTTSPTVAQRVQRAYSTFVTALCTRLRALHKQCIVTVMPRTSDRYPVWRGTLIPGVYDYTALGRAVSRLRVMAYDQHAGGYGPGPIAGMPWVRRIIAYTKTKVAARKVELGTPFYGRDFSQGSSVSLFNDDPINIARQHHVTPQWDSTQREFTFHYRAYGVRHTVWYGGPRGAAARTRLARRSGLGGAAYWAASMGMTGTWKAVRRK